VRHVAEHKQAEPVFPVRLNEFDTCYIVVRMEMVSVLSLPCYIERFVLLFRSD